MADLKRFLDLYQDAARDAEVAAPTTFEQGSALAGYAGWEFSTEPLTDDDETAVAHNPTPSML